MGASKWHVTMIFPDGTELSGHDARDLLARLGRLQGEPREVEEMKQLLSDRAWVWSMAAVDPLLEDEEFLDVLGESGMVFVTRRGRPAPPKKGG